ncbi:MAG TPA: hypothetical protein VEL51_11645, partial [Vicinamibacterales bacterium]|nr:hypothetical protein [Vicinamibacterales bacterium]
EAIDEFDRERALAQPHRLYGREYTMHAHLGHGAALLRAARREDAARSFRSALALYPDHPLPGAGLALATGTSFDARVVTDPLIRGIVLAALGQVEDAESTLAATIGSAPPGFTGWWLPVEPFLQQQTDSKALTVVRQLLVDRTR